MYLGLKPSSLMSSQLEAMPEAVPLQHSANGLHLYECCQIQLSAFVLLAAALAPLPLDTVALLIRMVIGPALYV